MHLVLTVDRAATGCADHWLSSQGLTEARKNEIRAASKYNLLVTAFNSSTLLLVATLISTLFFSYTLGFTLLVFGLFTRLTTEKELEKYTLPPRVEDRSRGGVAGVLERLRLAVAHAMLRHALHQATPEEKAENVFQNVGLPTTPNWSIDGVIFLEWAFWKNQVPLPEAENQAISEEEAAPSSEEAAPEEGATPSPAAPGFFAGLASRVFGV